MSNKKSTLYLYGFSIFTHFLRLINHSLLACFRDFNSPHKLIFYTDSCYCQPPPPSDGFILETPIPVDDYLVIFLLFLFSRHFIFVLESFYSKLWLCKLAMSFITNYTIGQGPTAKCPLPYQEESDDDDEDYDDEDDYEEGETDAQYTIGGILGGGAPPMSPVGATIQLKAPSKKASINDHTTTTTVFANPYAAEVSFPAPKPHKQPSVSTEAAIVLLPKAERRKSNRSSSSLQHPQKGNRQQLGSGNISKTHHRLHFCGFLFHFKISGFKLLNLSVLANFSPLKAFFKEAYYLFG